MNTSLATHSDLPAAPNPVEGQKFKLLAELGRGGMATVYLASVRGPAGFTKLYVVKCLRPSLAAEPEFLEMFLAEARLAARINHPNVVQTNEVGFEGGFYYIAMEYVEGPSLEALTRKAGESLPPKLYLQIVIQVLNGLHHAHELKDYEGQALNVVHRDVSPHNIMVSYDGNVKLLDFGIAKAADSGSQTRTGILKGKCAYMAAEQFGGRDIDRRADIFAVGIILWQGLTGSKLWKGLSDAEIFSCLARGEIPSPKTLVPDLPDELVDITMKALASSPEDRYQTAAEFGAALDGFVSTHPEYHTSIRDLAGYVAELFAAERAKMTDTVEERLRQVAATGTNLVSFSFDTSASQVSGMTGRITSTPDRRARWRSFGAIAVAICALGGFGLFAVKSFGVAAVSRDGEGTGQAKLTVRASPEVAKVFFDDAPLAGNPATAAFRRDGLAHRVRAEAPAYKTKTELVVLDSATVTVELVLEPSERDPEVDAVGNRLTALSVKVSPPSAALYLDDSLLPQGQAVVRFPRDGRDHVLRAQSHGHVTKAETVRFDRPTATMAITLEREAAVAARPGAPPAPPAPPNPPKVTPIPKETTAAPPPPSPVVTAAASTAPPASARKGIDRNDPWSK